MRPALAPLLCAALALWGCSAIAEPLRPGLYEGLMLAVAPDRSVTGRFLQQQGEGVVKSCAFSLNGRMDAKGVAKVTAWSKTGKLLRGEISGQADGVTLTLPNAGDLPGCGSVLPPLVEEGLTLDRTLDGEWSSLVRVAVPRALFKTETGVRARGYVVEGDVLAVIRRRAGLLQVSYISPEGKETRAWVRAADTTPLAPPPGR
jgi:hypothetical protein